MPGSALRRAFAAETKPEALQAHGVTEGETDMNLLTKEIRNRLPKLYATQNETDPVIQVKFFTPWTNWTWFITEFDGADQLFGLVEGFETEWGYSSLSELETIRGPGGLRIERDRFFDPVAVSSIPSLRRFVRG